MTKPRKPHTIRTLAKKLGCSHASIASWRARFPGVAPAGNDVRRWRKFLRVHGLGGTAAGELAQLRRARITAEELRVRKLRRELDIADRQTITIAEVDAMHLQMATTLRAELYNACESVLPVKLEGLTAVQVRVILREFADGLCDRLAAIELEHRERAPAD